MAKWTDGRRCPICGNNEYETHSLVLTYHECVRCSVMFRDADKFGDMGRHPLTAEDIRLGAIDRQGDDG